RMIQIAPRRLQQEQLIFDVMRDEGEQITHSKPTHHDEQHYPRERDPEPAVEFVARMNDREQRAEDAGIDVQRKQRLQRDARRDSAADKRDTLCDYICEREEHEHGPGDPKRSPDSAARKTRRAMDEEAEPRHEQEADTAADDDAFTLLHR